MNQSATGSRIAMEEMEESGFTGISSIGMDIKSVMEKLQKMETTILSIERENSPKLSTMNPSIQPMMEMVWKFGEKFCELKLKMEGMEKEIDELKGEKDKFKNVNEEMAKELAESKRKNKELGVQIGSMKEEIDGLKNKMNKLSAKNGEFRDEMAKLAHENGSKMAKISEENGKLKGNIDGVKADITELKEEIVGKQRTLKETVIESQNKIIEGIKNGIGTINAKISQLDQATDTLNNNTTQIDKLNLAVESLKLEVTKFDVLPMEMNKWNSLDSGAKIEISENNLLLTRIKAPANRDNSVRAILPIPKLNSTTEKPYIAFYFEVAIVKMEGTNNCISIGICSKQFHLEGTGKLLGKVKNSMGICGNQGMWIEGAFSKFNKDGADFKIGNVIGIGLVHSPANSSIKCFSSCNGVLMGSIELPKKFARLELFPAATLCYPGNSIRANFGKYGWRFNPSQIAK